MEEEGRNENVHDLGEEADRLKALMQTFNPHLNTLRRSIAKLDHMIQTSKVKDDSRVKRLLCELDLLKPYLTQSRKDMADIWVDLESLLRATGKNPPMSDISSTQQKDMDGVSSSAQEEESGSDVSNGNSEDEYGDASFDRGELSSPSRQGKTNGEVSGVSNQQASSSLMEVSNSVAEGHQSGTLSSCNLCGATTESDNNHTKENVAGEETSSCTDCGASLEGFETVWNHLVTPKLEVNDPTNTTDSMKGSQNKTKGQVKRKPKRSSKQKTSSIPTSSCELCGKECKNPSALKKHKYHLHSTERPWMCEVCGKSFRSKQSATQCKHSKKLMFPQQKCRECGEGFENIGSLRVHLRLVHDMPETQQFPCLICKESFPQGKELREHLVLHTPDSDEPLVCKICDKDFLDPSSFRHHLLRHKNKSHSCEVCGKACMDSMTWRHHKDSHLTQVSCPICGRILSSECKLKEHMNIHTGDKPIECDVCHKKLPTRSALRNHKARMHNKGNVGNKCVICGEVFKTNFARNSHHYNKHTEEERRQHNVVVKMFMCDFCGKTLRLEYKTSHLNKHKNKNEIRHVCDICGKGFIRLSLLKMHMAEHRDTQGDRVLTEEEKGALESSLQFETEYELKHSCDICGEKFRFVNSLAYHKKIHLQAGEKPFRCESCGKLFKHEHRLRAHEKRHLGEEQVHMCEICGKGFPRYVQLQSHLITHSDFRPYACHICNLGFKHHKNMLRHVRLVHNGERRFTCDVCGKSFGTKSVLKIHSRIHTGEKPYSCEICGHAFSDPSTLYKHRMLHTKKEPKSPEPEQILATVFDEEHLAELLANADPDTTIFVLT